ncbi:MAG: mechanosensitive ion channel family protein [Methanomassiliicoccus sp.]|nr:mechanosensitive ion channel family protein [Methanomassiliicoccus sp.]
MQSSITGSSIFRPMVWVPALPMLEMGDAEWMNDVGWPILALVGVLTVSLYLWSYLSKNYEIWKAHEGRYFDFEVLEASRRMAFIFIVSLLFLCCYVVVSLVFHLTTHPDWPEVTSAVFKLFAMLIIILAARLVVMVLNRMARKHGTETAAGTRMPAALEYSAVILSYIIYIVSSIVVLLLAVSIFTEDLDLLFSNIGAFLSTKNPAILGTIAVIVGIYLAIKMEETILEDVKFRSRKFNPQVIDLIQVGIRYILTIIGVLIVLYNLFYIIEMGDVGVLLVLVTLIFIILGIVMAHSTVQNIISGLVLMDVTPFDVGDRIRIMNDMVGDVFEKGLVFTKIKTLTGEIVDIPNSKVIRQDITNFSRLPSHGVVLNFDVSFEIPHEMVESYVKEALQGVEGILNDPKPSLQAEEIKGRVIRYKLVFFTKDVQREASLRSAVINRIQDIFHTEGHKFLGA